MKRFFMTCVLILPMFCVGCGGSTKSGMKEFTDVCNDHRSLSAETCDALIKSIEMELTSRRASNSLSPADEKALSDLIQRLTYMAKQGDAIANYVNINQPDDQLIKELREIKWTK